MNVLRAAALICAVGVFTQAQAAEIVLARSVEPDAKGAELEALPRSVEADAIEAALAGMERGENRSDKALTEALRHAYAAAEYEAFWVVHGKPSRQMVALRRHMAAAQDYGLDPAVYVTPEPPAPGTEDPQSSAAADVAFSRAVALFVTHLSAGRIEPAAVGRMITLDPQPPDLGAALSKLSRTVGVALALSRHEPAHRQYHALKRAMAQLRARGADAKEIVVPDGASLKPGMRDKRVAVLRARLDLPLQSGDDPELYDLAVIAAVTGFQKENGLATDGIVGPRTLAALNGATLEEDLAAIIANLERWRWMPRDLGAFHVMVNIPEFTVRVVDRGATVHQARVVVGTPRTRTPVFSHVIDHLIVNPYWHIPASIVANEMLPEIVQDPAGYFTEHGYEVLAEVAGEMRVLDPVYVDWAMLDPRSVRIRQAPGERNALGRIKFMFPNRHSVYLHDTPLKSLFARDYRAYSHGCVRVDDPLDFADVLLKVGAPKWNSARIQELYGGRERRIDLDNPVPVHLAYFTRAVDAAGELRRFADIYGYDRELGELLAVPTAGQALSGLP